MTANRSYSELEETAKLLITADASKEVIALELEKMGVSKKVASQIAAKIRRRRQLKKISPYAGAAIVITVGAYFVYGWGWAAWFGLFSLIGLQALYMSDKRMEERRKR